MPQENAGRDGQHDALQLRHECGGDLSGARARRIADRALDLIEAEARVQERTDGDLVALGTVTAGEAAVVGPGAQRTDVEAVASFICGVAERAGVASALRACLVAVALRKGDWRTLQALGVDVQEHAVEGVTSRTARFPKEAPRVVVPEAAARELVRRAVQLEVERVEASEEVEE